MTTIKQIFERFGAEYQDLWADKMPEVHQKTIEAIVNCRSGYYGLAIYQCSQYCGIRPSGYFFRPVAAMSKIFAAKLRDQIINAGLYDLSPADAWNMNWVVNYQAMGCSTASMGYPHTLLMLFATDSTP